MCSCILFVMIYSGCEVYDKKLNSDCNAFWFVYFGEFCNDSDLIKQEYYL